MIDHIPDKPRVRFLTCLWGREHRTHWLTLSLPSLLAPGNLPALVAYTDLEFVILTDRNSVDATREHPTFRLLEKLCKVRFLAIDDLIVGMNYGVTLTLAYARGIIDAGPEQTSTTFVFMNSDFILADGSLATLASKIRAGHRCIVAPSLRASAERLLPQLHEAVEQHRLALKPRTLVAMALANLHLTVLGKIADQGTFHCLSFNQAYWRLDESTLLGRYHLLFMLCIRPERPLGPVNSYCDYGLIPELVPASPMVALTDSDEFFMLELSPEKQEQNLLRFGPAKLSRIAGSLRRWTTKEHRHSAEFDFIFHSGPLPQNLGSLMRNAASFIARLHAQMGRSPVSHVNHAYWIRGLQHWLRAKVTGPVVQFPPELVGGNLGRWLVRYVRLVAWMLGTPPDVPICAYDWNDYRLVRQWLASLGKTTEKSVLFICPEDSPLRPRLAADPRIETLTSWNDYIAVSKIAKCYRYILLHANTDFLSDSKLMLDLAEAANGGEIAIFLGNHRRHILGDNLHRHLNSFIRESVWRSTHNLSWDLRVVNGYLQRVFGRLLFGVADRSLDDFIKARPRWAPIAIVVCPVLILVIAILNACFIDRLALRLSTYRSSALLRCRRADETKKNHDFGERSAT